MKIILGTQELKITAGSVTRRVDTGADGWECTIPWAMGNDPKLDELIIPRTFTDSEVYIDDNLVMRGQLFKRQTKVTSEGSTAHLNGFSKTKHLIDSNAKPPYERKDLSLLGWGKIFSVHYGIEALSEDPAAQEIVEDINSAEEIFGGGVKIKDSQKIFEFLNNLARQRGLLVTNTIDDDLLFLKPLVTSPSVGSITEGDLRNTDDLPTGVKFEATWDDSKVFAMYRSVIEASVNWIVDSVGIAVNSNIRVPRFKHVPANDQTVGGVQKAADWAKNYDLAQSLQIIFPVIGWTAPNGEIWKPNTIVTLTSPTSFLPHGYNLYIRGVTYILEENKKTAVLDLVPPEFYTLDDIVEPWVAQ